MTVTEPPPPPDGRSDTEALARVRRCRLSVAFVGDGEPVTFTPILDRIVGPSLAGVPVLASDGSTLAMVAHLPDGSTHVWSGTPEHLEPCAELAPGMHLAALVHRAGTWHLFGALDASRPYHAISHDLTTWHHDRRFAEEHPHLRVHGAAATADEVVVLGHVVSSGRPIGWTLLVQEDAPEVPPSPRDPVAPTRTTRTSRATPIDSPRGDQEDVAAHRRVAAAGRFRAREITFPLAPEHVVVGPTAIRADELAMAVTSGATRLFARTARGSRGRSWTLGLMSPDVEARTVFPCGGEVWVAGVDPAGERPMLAVVGRRAFHLDRSGGAVCAAVAHGEHLVLARLPVADDAHGEDDHTADSATAGASGSVAAFDRVDDQSSPAYIDSISAA